MDNSTKEFFTVVSEKLQFIMLESTRECPSNDEIRKISADMRFLFIDGNGNLKKAWKTAGLKNEPKILVPSFLNKTDNSVNSTIFTGGGANINGMQIMGFSYSDRALSDEEIKADYEKERASINAPAEQIGLNAYLNSKVVKVNNIMLSRREIIKYVANKLGGVHYDEKGRDQNVESFRHEVRLLDQDPIYFELLSYAQQVSESPDIKLLANKIYALLTTS